MTNSDDKLLLKPKVIEANLEFKTVFYSLYYASLTCLFYFYFYFYFMIKILGATMFDILPALGLALAFFVWDLKSRQGRILNRIFRPRLSRVQLFHEKIIIEKFSNSTEIPFSEIEKVEFTQFSGLKMKLKNGKNISVESYLKIPLKIAS